MSSHDDLAQDAKSKVNEIKTAAQDRLTAEAADRADALRTAAAEEAENAAHAAEAAAHEFDANSLQAQAAHQIAEQIEGVAAQLRTTDFNTVIAQTSDFARRNPLLFIGGAAALGFAATRFLKARKPEPISAASDDDPWRTAPASAAVTEMRRNATVTQVPGGARHG